MKAKTIPLSLYIHLPWCIKKCPYCDFNSHALKNNLPEDEYVDVLIADLKLDLKKLEPRPIQTIFFGGGTPSLFSAKALDRLLNAIAKECQLAADIEITLEANPGTVEQEKFNGFRTAGINRLSIGIQSFNPEKLKILGRIHDDNEAIKAAATAHQAGFDNFNLDLMFGLPSQTITQALDDLKMALSLKPTHLSWYQLTLEPNTLFYQKPPLLPGNDLIWEMQQQGQALLAENGFNQYEISAYSQHERECRHNLNYWQFGDYLGMGAGAHGKITTDEKTTRTLKNKHPKDYLDVSKPFLIEEKIITEKDLPFEFMMNALRLNQKIPFSLFTERTGLSIDSIQPQLKQAKEKGLLHIEQQHLQTTDFGRRFLNDLLQIFL